MKVESEMILCLPVGRILILGSDRSTGMKSLSHIIVGSGFPVALHVNIVLRSFSTAFSEGLSTIRGYPLGAVIKWRAISHRGSSRTTTKPHSTNKPLQKSLQPVRITSSSLKSIIVLQLKETLHNIGNFLWKKIQSCEISKSKTSKCFFWRWFSYSLKPLSRPSAVFEGCSTFPTFRFLIT